MKDENIPTTGRDGHLCRDGHGFFERTKFFVKKGIVQKKTKLIVQRNEKIIVFKNDQKNGQFKIFRTNLKERSFFTERIVFTKDY